MHRTKVRPVAAGAAGLVAALVLAGCPSDKVRVTGADVDDPTTSSGPTTTAVLGGSVSDHDGDGDDDDDHGGGGAARSTTTRSGGTGGSATTAAGSRSTTTSASGGSGGVVLRGSSFGAASIGDGADAAVAAVTRSLGKPSRDRTSPGAACPGPDRLVEWGRFSIAISGGKVTGWAYGNTPAGPPYLKTSAGVTTGSTLAAVKRAYPGKVQVFPGDDFNPSAFQVKGTGLSGYLDSSADSGKVTYLYSGVGCGE